MQGSYGKGGTDNCNEMNLIDGSPTLLHYKIESFILVRWSTEIVVMPYQFVRLIF